MEAATSDETGSAGAAGPSGLRPPGRPRDPAIAPRVMAAAAAHFGEVGYERASLAAISERSGVGKPSIYLRWADRHELFLACVRALGPVPPAPPRGGSLAGDLAAWSDVAAGALAGPDRGLVRAALFSRARDPEVAAALDDALLAPLAARLGEVLARWPPAGAGGPDDPRVVADLLLAPILHAVAAGRPPGGHRLAAELVARALRRAA
jgi:AcrR family transcriptional regulator